MAGKKYREAAKRVDPDKRYPLEEALQLVVGNQVAKFDETVELAVRLGVDPRQADQNVRGTVVLPNGTGRVERVLMPNPRVGTVTFDIAKAVAEVKAGKVDYRVDKAGVVHARIGKISFGEGKLSENAHALIDAIVRAKPSSAKGNYVKSVAVTSTMGPGIKVDPTTAIKIAAAA